MQYLPWIALIVEIISAMIVAKVAKNKIQPAMAVPTALAFAIFHVTYWTMSQEALPLYIIGTIASVPFLFGTAFITTGCVTVHEQQLCINDQSRMFKLIKKLLPIKFEGRSICEISWTAAAAIFVLPVMTTVFIMCMMFITLVVCTWNFQNPIQYFKDVMALQTWPETTMRKNKYGVWISPTPYAIAIYAVYILQKDTLTAENINITNIIIAILAVAVVTKISAYAIKQKWQQMDEEQKTNTPYNIKKAVWNMQDKPKEDLWLVWNFFWQVFKHKFCPKIKYGADD